MSEDNNNKNNEEDPKPFQWTDKTKKERVGNKMLLLCFFAILFIVVLFVYFKSDTSGKGESDYADNTTEVYENESEDNNTTNEAEDIEKKYENEDTNNDNNEFENDEPEESTPIPKDANEYEEEYLEEYSEELLNGLKKNSKPVMDLYFAQKEDTEFWDKIGSDNFNADIEDNLADKKEKPKSYDFFATEPYNDDEIIIGVLAETEENNTYYNLIYKEKDNQVKLDEIVFMWDM